MRQERIIQASEGARDSRENLLVLAAQSGRRGRGVC